MPAAVQAGDLDRRIVIRRETTTPSAYNEPVATWSDLVTLWAKRQDASTGEATRAQEIGAQVTTWFWIRYSDLARSITPKDRVAFEGREYNITGVRAIERNQWLEIAAVARDDRAAI